jgi:hypothetical protein
MGGYIWAAAWKKPAQQTPQAQRRRGQFKMGQGDGAGRRSGPLILVGVGADDLGRVVEDAVPALAPVGHDHVHMEPFRISGA